MVDQIPVTEAAPVGSSPAAAAAPQGGPPATAPAAPLPSAVEAAPAAQAAPEAPALRAHTAEPGLLTQALADHDAKTAPKPAEAAPGAADPAATEPAAAEAAKKPAEGEKPAEAKAEEAKPDEAAKPEGEAKPAEAKPDEEKPAEAAPFEYKYTLPETLKLDDGAKAEVHTALDKFRADPTNPQPLIDLYHAKTQAFAEEFQRTEAQRHHDAFREMRKEWGDEIKADPQMGGSGIETTKAAVARMRDKLVRPEFLQTRSWPDGSPRPSRFAEFIETTGAADSVVFWDILHNASRALDEPQKLPPPGGRPVPNNGARAVTRLRDTYNPRQT